MVFFFPVLFFFSAFWKWVSEWSVNFSGKKNDIYVFIFIKTPAKFEKVLPVFELFWGNLFFCESGLQTFHRKKMFFLKREEKKNQKMSEWVSERWTFPGKNKIWYIWVDSNRHRHPALLVPVDFDRYRHPAPGFWCRLTRDGTSTGTRQLIYRDPPLRTVDAGWLWPASAPGTSYRHLALSAFGAGWLCPGPITGT